MNDQAYIDNIKSQVASGMYDHLFTTGRTLSCGEVHSQCDTYHKEGHPEFRRDLVFLDIGANVGIVSIYAVPYCKRIVAVEPAPATFGELVKNTRTYPMIECVCAALTPSDGQHEFFVNDINFTASSTVNTYGQRTSVEGRRLITILQENDITRVDVCKIDAEGAEGESLDYLQLDYAKDIIKTYFIETHNCPKTTWEHKLGTIVGNLARCGYSKMSIDGMAITATRP